MKPYRQGDLVLTPAEIPPEAVDITPPDGRIILARGSSSAHQHAFVGQPVRLFDHKGARYIRVDAYAELGVLGDTSRHRTHIIPQILPRGYEVRLQQEYTPQAWRDVND